MGMHRTERRPAPGDPRVIVALDFPDMMSAFALAAAGSGFFWHVVLELPSGEDRGGRSGQRRQKAGLWDLAFFLGGRRGFPFYFPFKRFFFAKI